MSITDLEIKPLQPTKGQSPQKVTADTNKALKRRQCLVLGRSQYNAPYEWSSRDYHWNWHGTNASSTLSVIEMAAPPRQPLKSVEFYADILPIYRAGHNEEESFEDSKKKGAKGVIRYSAWAKQIVDGDTNWSVVGQVETTRYKTVTYTPTNAYSESHVLRTLALQFHDAKEGTGFAYQEGTWDPLADAGVEEVPAKVSVELDGYDPARPLRLEMTVQVWTSDMNGEPGFPYDEHFGWADDGNSANLPGDTKGDPDVDRLHLWMLGFSAWGLS